MIGDDIPSLAEAMAEIRRLQHRIELLQLDVETLTSEQHLDYLQAKVEELKASAVIAQRESDRHISRLQVRITELEGAAAITFGTLEQPTPDWPTTIEHNIPPNAPSHDE
jgi:hypothetical protein